MPRDSENVCFSEKTGSDRHTVKTTRLTRTGHRTEHGFFVTLRQIRLRTREWPTTGPLPMCGFWLRFILIGAAMTNSNRILSAAIAVSAMLGMGAASAADLAVKAMPVAAPVFTWTGCYVGVHAGAGVLHDQGYQPNGQILADDRHGVGGLGGGQVGCNYQTGMLVLGVEGEGYWSGMKVTVDRFGGTNGNTLFETATIKNKWDYDIAGRFG